MFVSITVRHSSSARSSGRFRMLIPALLTRMSIPPRRSATVSAMCRCAADSVTSASIAIVLAPIASSADTARADFPASRPTTAMLAPARASPRAIPNPMPPLPPVTTATFPVRSNRSMGAPSVY